jgi:hypothetical protein
MIRFRRPGLPGLFALCLAFVGVQVAGVHIHLCLDGQESPSSLHLSDAGLHADHHDDDAEHDDVDLTDSWGALAKKPQPGLDLPAAVRTLHSLLQPAARPVIRPALDTFQSSLTGYRHYRPPLRAPPV